MNTPTPKKKCLRKLFESSPSKTTNVHRSSEVQESPSISSPEADVSFPVSWEIEGVDLEERLRIYREELDRKNDTRHPVAAPDPTSLLRTEYRKILMAINIFDEMSAHQDKQIEWMRNALKMSEQDEQDLQKRRKTLEELIEKLRSQVISLNANISKNTQKAVKTVIEIKEDDDIAEDDANPDDDYEKFTKISRLCEVALTSYEDVIRKTKQMKHDLAILRRKTAAKKKLCIATAPSTAYNEISKLLKSQPLEKLRIIEDICE